MRSQANNDNARFDSTAWPSTMNGPYTNTRPPGRSIFPAPARKPSHTYGLGEMRIVIRLKKLFENKEKSRMHTTEAQPLNICSGVIHKFRNTIREGGYVKKRVTLAIRSFSDLENSVTLVTLGKQGRHWSRHWSRTRVCVRVWNIHAHGHCA